MYCNLPKRGGTCFRQINTVGIIVHVLFCAGKAAMTPAAKQIALVTMTVKQRTTGGVYLFAACAGMLLMAVGTVTSAVRVPVE
ncbi:MAG: hypothetical protein HWN68_00300 [Desulfobacterales bacterium]|nr:hypothetical protein [Desulfobacterales bacterium]